MKKNVVLTDRKIKYPVTLREDLYECVSCHQETRDQGGEGQFNLCLDCYCLDQWQHAFDKGLTTLAGIPPKYRDRIVDISALEHAKDDAREQEQHDAEVIYSEDDRAGGPI